MFIKNVLIFFNLITFIFNLIQIDPVILANAAEWSEHRSPDGRMYYYSMKTAESVWEKPEALRNLDCK